MKEPYGPVHSGHDLTLNTPMIGESSGLEFCKHGGLPIHFHANAPIVCKPANDYQPNFDACLRGKPLGTANISIIAHVEHRLAMRVDSDAA